MKKILLLAALAASFAPAYAEGFSDTFKLTYEGETLTDGQTITVANYFDAIVIDNPEFAGLLDPDLKCVAEIYATNVTEEPKEIEFSLNVIEPSVDEFASGKFGVYQLCYGYETGSGNCLGPDQVKNYYAAPDPVSAEEYIKLDIDQTKFTDLAPVTLQLDVRAMEDDKETGKATVFIKFTHEKDITMAVEGIEAANTKAEYFTIQGVRVAEPQKGQLVIERRGSKVAKRIF